MLTNSKIFNWRFYLYSNPDLITFGLVTEAQAQAHWVNNGIYEGRQAHGAFSPLQYLQQYPDLLAHFWYNYPAVALHYVNNGAAEGRIGHMRVGAHGDPFGAYKRITITGKYAGGGNNWNTPVTVSMSKMFAGAIDSISWRDFEFVNSYDHGRQIQYAWQYGSYATGTVSQPTFEAPNAERYNPTEAGTEQNAVGLGTSSRLISHSFIADNVLTTVTEPAYWKPPNDSYNNYTTVNSRDILSKTTVVGPSGVSGLIRIDATVTPETGVPSKAVPTRYEVPSMYISPVLDSFYQVNSTMTALTPIANSKYPTFSNTVMWDGNPSGGWYGAQGGEVPRVVIACQGTHGYAIGAVVVPDPSHKSVAYQVYFQNYQVANTSPVNRTRTIGPVVYTQDGSKILKVRTYVAVGENPWVVMNLLREAVANSH
jgi:hypothetical protein